VTKASLARRERRGRRKGSHAPLLKDRQRFTIAVWLAFVDFFGPHESARLAIVLVEETTPITIETIENLLVVAAADYRQVSLKEDFDDRARALTRKVELIRGRASGHELKWLVRSSGAVRALVDFVAVGDVGGANRAIMLLEHAGWGDILEHVQGRIDAALRSNWPPFEGQLKAAGRRLLAAARGHKANNLRAL
jgi:hypothetical protein